MTIELGQVVVACIGAVLQGISTYLTLSLYAVLPKGTWRALSALMLLQCFKTGLAVLQAFNILQGPQFNLVEAIFVSLVTSVLFFSILKIRRVAVRKEKELAALAKAAAEARLRRNTTATDKDSVAYQLALHFVAGRGPG